MPLIPVWYFDYLPLQDYPNHFARLSILSSYEHSDFYKNNFTLKPLEGTSPLTYTCITLERNTKGLTIILSRSFKSFILFIVLIEISSFV
jgi:hypothetical protein